MSSQFEEEKYILKAVGETPGRFLDVGCWDPITFSNTRALVERGWSGVMIEPAPGPFIELLRCCTKCGVGVDEREHERYGERKQRECSKCGGLRYGFDPRFTLIHGAVGLEAGLMELWVTDDALSTSDEESRKKWDELGGFYGKMLAPVITLPQISNRFGGFDFINFDVEGYSAELFLQALTLGWQAKCICVEHDNRTTELLSAATANGYHAVLVNSTNVVVTR